MITSSIILFMVPLTGIQARHFKGYKKHLQAHSEMFVKKM